MNISISSFSVSVLALVIALIALVAAMSQPAVSQSGGGNVALQAWQSGGGAYAIANGGIYSCSSPSGRFQCTKGN